LERDHKGTNVRQKVEAGIRQAYLAPSPLTDVADFMRTQGIGGMEKLITSEALRLDVNGDTSTAAIDSSVGRINAQIRKYAEQLKQTQPALFETIKNYTGMDAEATIGMVVNFLKGTFANKLALMAPSGSMLDGMTARFNDMGRRMHWDMAKSAYLAQHPGATVDQLTEGRWEANHKLWAEAARKYMRQTPPKDIGPMPAVEQMLDDDKAGKYKVDLEKRIKAAETGTAPETPEELSKKSVTEYFKTNADQEVTQAEGSAPSFKTVDGKVVQFSKDAADTFTLKIDGRVVQIEDEAGAKPTKLHLKNPMLTNTDASLVTVRINNSAGGVPMKAILGKLVANAAHDRLGIKAGATAESDITSKKAP
jgi:hypothetical protein